jgi:hypothetical protein
MLSSVVRSRSSFVSAICLAVSITGCAEWLDRVDQRDMAARLEYQGFSFDRPPSEHWFMRHSEEAYTHVHLWRDLSDAHPSKTHTFYAHLNLAKIPRVPTSAEDFAELVRADKQTADYEVKLVSYTQEATQRQNQWCIRFDSAYSVVGAPVSPDRPLVMTMHGYRCLHPTWPKTVLDFVYSERGLPDELDPKLDAEGEEFLKGVRIDVAPNTPAS